MAKKYCPVCGSDKIRWVMPEMWSIYECEECGYRGALIIEDVDLAKKLKSKKK